LDLEKQSQSFKLNCTYSRDRNAHEKAQKEKEEGKKRCSMRTSQAVYVRESRTKRHLLYMRMSKVEKKREREKPTESNFALI